MNLTARLAQQFAWVGVGIDLVEGISEGYYDFLEVVEKGSVFQCVG